MATKTTLPQDAAERKATPVVSGVLDYFPAALAEVARVSKAGNDQHNPGEPLHWARGKSSDHADALLRHLMERGAVDTDGLRHSAKAAWRALALLQEELEAAGAPAPRGAVVAQSSEVLWTGDALWEARVTARGQGRLRAHAVGVCALCDATYPLTSGIARGVHFVMLPEHEATA